jgi:hypothetical protein
MELRHRLVDGQAAGVLCSAPCPPADKPEKASASSFTCAEQSTPPARRSSAMNREIEAKSAIRSSHGWRGSAAAEGVGRVSRSTAPRCRSRLAVQSKPWPEEEEADAVSLLSAGGHPAAALPRRPWPFERDI